MVPSDAYAYPSESHADALEALLSSSALLVSSSSQQEVFSSILDIASNVLAADAYAFWRELDDTERWRAVATRGFSPSYPTEIHVPRKEMPCTVQAVENVLENEYLSARHSAYAAEGIRSLLLIPVQVHENRSSTVTLYWRQPRTFSQVELDYAVALSNLAVAALHHAELQEQNARERLRLSFLSEASAILASSLDYETTLNRVGQLAVPQIADWCFIHVLEDAAVQRIVVAHSDPDKIASSHETSSRYPEEIRPDRGLGLVLRTGKTELQSPITDEGLAKVARTPEHLGMLRDLQMTSSLIVPLKVQERILGAIRLVAAGSDRYFTEDDVQLAEELARRAAMAIENARLHRAVVEQQNQLRLAHAAARTGAWTWNIRKGEFHASEEFSMLQGLPGQPSVDARGVRDMIHPEDRERVLSELATALKSGSDQLVIEHRTIRPNGDVLWVQSRGSIHRDEHGHPVAITGISMDITESRAAEDTLRRTEKLAATGRLAATIAHEVNNPLEALTNLVFLARNTEGLPPEADAFLHTADSELRRVAHIVRQTLGFYRETSKPRPTDLCAAVTEMTELYRSRAENRRVHLTHQSEPDCYSMVNPGEVKQVISNLVSNAIDATPPGGVVNVAVAHQGTSIEIKVSDTGTGIRSSDLPRLFEPFFTTKTEIGTGLGLWVSKGIVEKHNGTIQVESSTTAGDSGTQVMVTLPALDPNSLKSEDNRHHP